MALSLALVLECVDGFDEGQEHRLPRAYTFVPGAYVLHQFQIDKLSHVFYVALQVVQNLSNGVGAAHRRRRCVLTFGGEVVEMVFDFLIRCEGGHLVARGVVKPSHFISPGCAAARREAAIARRVPL